MSIATENTTHLMSYGAELVAAGYEVWFTPTYSDGGYLQYRDPATGACGSLQRIYHQGWTHLMPMVPSRENGSAMHLDTDLDPFTVEAARECAQPTNSNAVVGLQRNAGDSTWRSSNSQPLHTS